MIELKHLSKTFETAGGRVDALKDVSLTIPDGDVYGIIGMSGAGKSTLVRCINMLERPTEGEVIVNGQRLDTMTPAQLRAARREITMIFQRFNLLMQRTCLKNVCFPMELSGVPKAQAEKKALELRRWRCGGADLHGNGHPVDYPFLSGTTNEEVTRFLLDGRRIIREKTMGEDRTARDIVALPAMAQFRKTRRLDGAYTLTERDCHAAHADSIGLAADFEKVGDWYEIPYGCLYHPNCDNMLAAGRMISSDGWAWDVTRVIPVCALTGQAAGLAAAQIAATGQTAAALPAPGRVLPFFDGAVSLVDPSFLKACLKIRRWHIDEAPCACFLRPV